MANPRSQMKYASSPPLSALAGCGIMPAPASSTSRGTNVCSLQRGAHAAAAVSAGGGPGRWRATLSSEHPFGGSSARKQVGAEQRGLTRASGAIYNLRQMTVQPQAAGASHRGSASQVAASAVAVALLLACGTGLGSVAPLAACSGRCCCRRHSDCGAWWGGCCIRAAAAPDAGAAAATGGVSCMQHYCASGIFRGLQTADGLQGAPAPALPRRRRRRRRCRAAAPPAGWRQRPARCSGWSASSPPSRPAARRPAAGRPCCCLSGPLGRGSARLPLPPAWLLLRLPQLLLRPGA